MQTFLNWLIGEAGAAWIIGILGLLMGLYTFFSKSRKPTTGRHIICTQEDESFSHLTLSQGAREWLKVEFLGESRIKPIQINSLSQNFIKIKLESNTDALNSVELIFFAPEARILRVWWEDAPEYLIEESNLSYYLVNRSPKKIAGLLGSHWEIKVYLSQLKAYDKYKEEIKIGVLADGNLESLTMPPQGSKGGVTLDQVWTAKFIPYSEYEVMRKKERIRKNNVKSMYWISLLFLVIASSMWTFTHFFTLLNGFSCSGMVYGFILAGIFGFILSNIRFLRASNIIQHRPTSAVVDWASL